jgi:hypothetical protein
LSGIFFLLTGLATFVFSAFLLLEELTGGRQDVLVKGKGGLGTFDIHTRSRVPMPKTSKKGTGNGIIFCKNRVHRNNKIQNTD